MEVRMESERSTRAVRSWQNGSYCVSTDFRLIPLKKLMAVFESEDFYWAKTLPEAAMQEMLENSLTFGLYEYAGDHSHKDETKLSRVEGMKDTPAASNALQTDLDFIGVARCVTDSVTFVYLTDVWVDPKYQGKGLGKWLVKCVQEVVDEMPHLRRSMLFTSDWKRSVPFYKNLMGMSLIGGPEGQGLAIMERKGKGHPSFGSIGNSYQ